MSTPPPLVADPPAASIVGTFGYRVEGDTACLNAEIDWRHDAAEQGRWHLQLWARPLDAPGPAAQVAELAVTVPLHTHGEPLCVEGYVMAVPPAGTGPQAMTLRLVAVTTDGRVVQHDEVAFDQPERFVQPRLQGASLAPVVGQGPALVVDRVLNPRPADNLSGTLQLELWVLDQPYRGGPFDGRCIGSLRLEALPGQAEAGPLVMAVDGQAADLRRPWCLMLREWTAVGFVTRDYTVLPAPAPLPQPPLSAWSVAAPAVKPRDRAAPAELPPEPGTAYMPAASAHRPRPDTRRPAPRPAGGMPGGLGSRLMAHLRQFLQR